MVNLYKHIEKSLSGGYLEIRGLPTETIEKRSRDKKETFLLVQDKETHKYFKIIVKEK